MTPLLCFTPKKKPILSLLTPTIFLVLQWILSVAQLEQILSLLFFCCIFPENNQRPNNRLELKLFLFCPSKWLPTAIIAIYSRLHFQPLFSFTARDFPWKFGCKKERETKTCTSQHQLLFFPQSNLRGQKVFLKWTHNEIVTLGGKFRYFTHQHILTI